MYHAHDLRPQRARGVRSGLCRHAWYQIAWGRLDEELQSPRTLFCASILRSSLQLTV